MDDMMFGKLLDGGAVTILGGLCFYLVIHFNKAINKTNEVINANTKAIETLADTTNRQLAQLERIEVFVKRIEDKFDRLREECFERELTHEDIHKSRTRARSHG